MAGAQEGLGMGLWLGGMVAGALRSRLSEALNGWGGGSRLIRGIMGMEEASISNRLMTPIEG